MAKTLLMADSVSPIALDNSGPFNKTKEQSVPNGLLAECSAVSAASAASDTTPLPLTDISVPTAAPSKVAHHSTLTVNDSKPAQAQGKGQGGLRMSTTWPSAAVLCEREDTMHMLCIALQGCYYCCVDDQATETLCGDIKHFTGSLWPQQRCMCIGMCCHTAGHCCTQQSNRHQGRHPVPSIGLLPSHCCSDSPPTPTDTRKAHD